MKKTAYPFFAIFFTMFLLFTACRDGAKDSHHNGNAMRDSLNAVAVPVDTLAQELDQAVEDIEKHTSELKSALDSL